MFNLPPLRNVAGGAACVVMVSCACRHILVNECDDWEIIHERTSHAGSSNAADSPFRVGELMKSCGIFLHSFTS